MAAPKNKAQRKVRLARSGGSAQALHEINWMLIGSTDAYSELKKDIAHVCRDVTHAACIDEICVSDIVQTFKKHGYAVVPNEKLSDR